MRGAAAVLLAAASRIGAGETEPPAPAVEAHPEPEYFCYRTDLAQILRDASRRFNAHGLPQLREEQ